MFENLKLKLARIIITKKYLKNNSEPIVFNKVITNAVDFFIIMPESDSDFYNALDIIKFLQIHRKSISLFLPEHKYNLIPEKDKYKFVSFSLLQKTKLNLPDPVLTDRLKSKNFDVVIDLNRLDNVFFNAVVNIVDSKLRICIARPDSGPFYNFQFEANLENPEAAYRNLLNFLQMF